jgi:hypothetical protein
MYNLLLLLLCAAAAADGYMLRVYRGVLDSEAIDPTNFTMSTTSLVDDGPMEVVKLGWSFPYYDSVISAVSINPNGGLFMGEALGLRFCFSNSIPGMDAQYWFGGGACNFEQSFDNLIGMGVADL